jgi:DNA polymerase-3 subunit epsilon
VSDIGRQVIVCDCETTGLDLLHDWPIEVACVNVATFEEFYFVPQPPPGAFDNAGPALTINKYFERRVYEQIGMHSWHGLLEFLRGQTFAGSNPAFDSIMLLRGWQQFSQAKKMRDVWHHRLLDLAAYSAPALGVRPWELKGLHDVCDKLGVKNTLEHSALHDARATAECFRILQAQYGRFATDEAASGA